MTRYTGKLVGLYFNNLKPEFIEAPIVDNPNRHAEFDVVTWGDFAPDDAEVWSTVHWLAKRRWLLARFSSN